MLKIHQTKERLRLLLPNVCDNQERGHARLPDHELFQLEGFLPACEPLTVDETNRVMKSQGWEGGHAPALR